MVDKNISSILIIAQHAGIIARSLARSGIIANAIDQFGDEDLFECIDRHRLMELDHTGNIDAAKLRQAVEDLAPDGGRCGVIIGSGFDTRPDLLQQLLGTTRILLGNSLKTLTEIHTPANFFALLDNLTIAYPETRLIAPTPSSGWLYKQACSEGGKGVAFCTQTGKMGKDPRNAYYQRQVFGKTMSALFLAQAGRARIIGFNTLWSTATPNLPFLFAGAVNRADLTEAQQAEIGACIARLTTAYALVGLNSMDFIRDDDTGALRVLELNPRPSASVMLYDAALTQGLLWAHVQACLGKNCPELTSVDEVQAFRILYALGAMHIPKGLPWPAWCRDRPWAGARIAAGEPLCTITTQPATVAPADAAAAERLLEQRTSELFAMFEPSRIH